MGQGSSKKDESLRIAKPPITQLGHYERSKQIQRFAPRPISVQTIEKPFNRTGWLPADKIWRESLERYRATQEAEARITRQSDEIRKTHELDLASFKLKLRRETAENDIFTQSRPLPKPRTISSYLSNGHRLQTLRESDAKYFTPKKRRPELKDFMLRHIESVKLAPNNSLLTEIDGVQILGKDIRTLVGLNWLNDEIINAYMTLLAYRGKRPEYKTVHSFNTFFYPKLRESGYSSVRRWTRKVDVFGFDYILVPVHLGNHWTLVFIDLKQRTISYYDSLGGYNDGHCDILLDYLRSEMSDKKKQVFSDSGWQLLNLSYEGIPKQKNGSDCGVFACIYAEYLTREAEFDFSQDDMPYFRDRMIYEITNQRILE